jgi:hypothetical protein
MQLFLFFPSREGGSCMISVRMNGGVSAGF